MRLKLSCCILLTIVISVVYSKSLPGHKKKSKSNPKDVHHPKKRISTQQKLGSGHSKGPMANNVGGSVPLPVVMPFPMIPFDDRYPILFPPNKGKKGRGKKKDPKDETEDETDKDVDDENEGGGEEYKGQGKVLEKPQINTAPSGNKGLQKQEEGDEESVDEGSSEDNEDEEPSKNNSSKNENVERADDDKGGKDKDDDDNDDEEEESNEQAENVEDEEDDIEQEANQNKGKAKKKSRARRSAFEPIIGNPEDIMPYLMLDSEEETIADANNAHTINTRSIEEEPGNLFISNGQYEAGITDESEVPHVINTRSVDEEETELPRVIVTRDANEDEEDAPRDIRTRSLPDDIPDLQAAEKKVKDTEIAAEALTQIQKALGANPASAVEESHSLADYLRKETEQYDQEIAKDIIATQKAQTRSKIVVNDDGEKRDLDFVTAKRKLDNDRAKERELQQELKELKDIEFVTTELELAKYLATENARHQLQLAQAVNRDHVNQAPPPATVAQNTEYAPMVMQQPEINNFQPNYQPSYQEPQLAPQQPISASWQPVYPASITYAYNPVHETHTADFEGSSRGRGPIDSSNIFTQRPVDSYFLHEYQSPSGPIQQNTPVRPNTFFSRKYQKPRPSSVQHAEAQSRHINKPVSQRPYVQKARPYVQKANPRPYAEKASPRPYLRKVTQRPYVKTVSQRPYVQRYSSNRPAQEIASYAGRRPSFTFPGPTYSPPPYASRNKRPRVKANKNRRPSYRTGYTSAGYNNRRPSYTAGYESRKKSPALLSFFADQHRMPNMNNYYQESQLTAQQHYPMFTSSYRRPNELDQQGYHYVEKEQQNYAAQPSFVGKSDNKVQKASNTRNPVKEQKGNQRTATHQKPSTQPVTNKDEGSNRMQEMKSQPEMTSQYIQPPTQFSAFSTFSRFSPFGYQMPPAGESAAKEAIPSFYQPYNPPAVQNPYSIPQPFYPQNSRPFETMDTDSNVFHGENPPPAVQPQPQTPLHLANPEEVPLGYGLYPLPEGAEEKMEPEDGEVKEVYEHIKDDKQKLQETRQAADAVTKIENKVGFDPGSIAKLVDFVKQAAVKDVDLSQKAVRRDQVTIKRMEVAHATPEKDKPTNEDNVATKEAHEKLKVDQELLKESQERLDKIKRMELIVTGIEAAKYSALNRKGESLVNDVNKMNQLKAVKKNKVGKS